MANDNNENRKNSRQPVNISAGEKKNKNKHPSKKVREEEEIVFYNSAKNYDGDADNTAKTEISTISSDDKDMVHVLPETVKDDNEDLVDISSSAMDNADVKKTVASEKAEKPAVKPEVKSAARKADEEKNIEKKQAPKRKKPVKRIVLSIVSCVIAVAMLISGSGCIVLYSYLSTINYQAINTDDENSAADKKEPVAGKAADTAQNTKAYNGKLLNDEQILNVLLIGADTRKGETKGNSDTMILLSLDTKNKKLKLLSFMRDTWVSIPGYGENKLNAAFTYGGAELTVKTIQANYGIKIDRYAIVDFKSFKNIIDKLGGIDIELTQEEIKACIRKSTIANEMVPVTCGTSYKNKGVQKLLDAIIDYMPSPLDVPAIKGVNPDTEEEEERPSSDDEPFSALAFKIATDPFVGKLAFFRVYSGVINQGDTVLNATKDSKERFGRIVQMHANHRKDLTTVYSGDIAAAVGLKNTTTGDTLCDEKHPIILESMEFPEPVIQLAIEPKTKAGQEKMGIALAKLAEEDPTFKTWTDEETGQTIIAGMGELHLDIIVDRLLREFKVEANVGAPQVAYKETIKGSADIDYKYKKQSGGSGQYGHVKIRVSPNESGKGYEFTNAVVGGSIPKEYIPAVDAGIQGAMKAGILAGYEVVDVKVELYDGSYHEVDSSEMAFKIAGSIAFKEALKQANAVLMEPVMKVAVIVPDDYLGTVIGDLSSRRGQIQGQESRSGSIQVDALVPLSEMFGYTSDLRSNTQGRGQYTMEPHSYEEVPKSIAEKIMANRAKN